MADEKKRAPDLMITGLSGDETSIAIQWGGRFDGPYPGFGMVVFLIDSETGELTFDNECMSDEFNGALLDLLKKAKRRQ
jgi:hypothetical protein